MMCNYLLDATRNRVEDNLLLGAESGLDRFRKARDGLDRSRQGHAVRDAAAGALDGDILEGDCSAEEVVSNRESAEIGKDKEATRIVDSPPSSRRFTPWSSALRSK